jgi:hypothetical protein
MVSEKLDTPRSQGGINLKRGCNPGVGDKGLEILAPHADGTRTEYISNRDNTMDIQISIPNFGKAFQEGLDNTKKLATENQWHNDHDSLNWRDTPCSLRMSYDSKNDRFNVQMWNELLQVRTHLSLTREEIQKVLKG